MLKGVLILLLTSISILSWGQKGSGKELKAVVKESNTSVESEFFTDKQKGIIHKIAVLPFRFYKKYLTQQFAAECAYEPSCSVYGFHAVVEHGLFMGVFASADRLMRCNDYAAYHIVYIKTNSKNGKIIDHPSYYHSCKHK